jgi:hypothetical protein
MAYGHYFILMVMSCHVTMFQLNQSYNLVKYKPYINITLYNHLYYTHLFTRTAPLSGLLPGGNEFFPGEHWHGKSEFDWYVQCITKRLNTLADPPIQERPVKDGEEDPDHPFMVSLCMY